MEEGKQKVMFVHGILKNFLASFTLKIWVVFYLFVWKLSTITMKMKAVQYIQPPI
jgi:hypothetical protein